jgi:SAM-dependent methyltransferase
MGAGLTDRRMTSHPYQQSLTRLEVPENLHRNSPGVAARGYEETGRRLLELGEMRCGLGTLADLNVLDVGCGVRLTMTIINRQVSIKSYTGVEVATSIVDFLNQDVAAHDPRFKFLHWNAHNEMYNPNGVPLSTFERLPTEETFDIIWAFSLFTHLNPSDSSVLLRILRKHIRPNGRLFFSAFIDRELEGFDDRVEDSPLLNAYYGRDFMESVILKAGWNVDSFFDKDPDNAIMHSFLCSPLEGLAA